MSRVEVYYTTSSTCNREVKEARWLDPASGKLYMQESGMDKAIPGVFSLDAPGRWSTLDGITVEQEQVPYTQVGQKFDGDKDEPSLLMQGCNLAVAGVIAVLGFGFKKYGKRNGWKEVPEAPRRYKDALYRHLAAIERGEMIDPESGKPHWDHVACNAMFESQMYHEGSSNGL